MAKTPIRAGTSPFAHLLSSLGRVAKGGRADDDKPEDEMSEEDEKDDADADDGDDDAKKAKKADDSDGDEDDQDDPEADDDGDEAGDDDSDDAKKGKKAKKAEDEKTDDSEEKGDDKEAAAYRAGRVAERKRGARIFSSPAAGARPDLAAQLAFGTRMSSSEAIGLLETAAISPSSSGQSLRNRMQGVKPANPGSGPSGSGGASLADQIVMAGKKRRGEI